MTKRFSTWAITALLACSLLYPSVAFAEGDGDSVSASETTAASTASSGAATVDDLYICSSDTSTDNVTVSGEGDSATIENAAFAVENFTRAQTGSNRNSNGSYIGYGYYQGTTNDFTVAISDEDFVLVYVPATIQALCDITNESTRVALKEYFLALDAQSLAGGIYMSADVPWYFTTETSVVIDGVSYNFGVDAGENKYYVTVLGADGSDIVSANASAKPTHVEFLHVASQDNVAVTEASTGVAAFIEFLQGVDYSPLWVTLKTTLVAIVFIFILGLAAAYFSLRIPKRAQDIADTIFTIPMVLPPTVCGFVLLLLLGNNSSFGTWLMSIGIKLVFSWEATVIAAVVVAFPLMYRSARGAFENIDPNMLDAARTLGWSNLRIFFKLMLPLSWSSIAAGTVLAFARALGEFGATLFLAGNYVGITRTIPIAIYFEWMSGNTDVAVFWTVVIIIFSFIVILFINLWSRRTTKYRRGIEE